MASSVLPVQGSRAQHPPDSRLAEPADRDRPGLSQALLARRAQPGYGYLRGWSGDTDPLRVDHLSSENAVAVSPGAWPGATLMVSTGV